MRLEEALVESFRLWRENLWICLPFLFTLPLVFVTSLHFTAAFLPTLSLSHQLLPTLIALLLSLCAFVFAEAGVVRMAADLVSEGRTELGRALVPLQLFLRLLGLRLFLAAITFGSIGLVLLPSLSLLRYFAIEEVPAGELVERLQAIITALTAIFTLLPLLLLFLFLLVYLTSLVPYAIIVLGMGLIEGLKHGVSLIWRHKLRSSFIFGILLLISSLWWSFLPTLQARRSLSEPEQILYLTSPAYVISVVIWSVGLAFVMGFGAVLLAKLYFELVRGEAIPPELRRALGLQKFRPL